MGAIGVDMTTNRSGAQQQAGQLDDFRAVSGPEPETSG
jgi:hypothetical protein